MMKPFLNRILICVVPVVLALAVVGWATARYLQGVGGFKLGVDLVGGTILIYEIDASKFPNQAIPAGTAQKMAEKLKRRLDPADTYGIAIRAASESRVEIILPTGGEHQIKAERKIWNDILREAEEEYPVEHYTVGSNEAGRRVKLIAQVAAQHPDVPIEDIYAYISAEKDAEKKTEKDWDAFVEEVYEKWPATGYVVGRGKLDDLLSQIQIQQKEKLRSAGARTELQDFIDRQQKQILQQSLTGEGVQTVKEKVSRVGSLEFLILANDNKPEEKDRNGLAAATDFIAKALKREALKPGETVRAWSSPNLHEELENRQLNGFAPPSIKKEGNKLVCLGEKYDSSENYSYSWIELGPAFRQEHGLSDPRWNKDHVPSPTEKDLGQLIDITDDDVEQYFNTKAQLPADDPKLTEKDRLISGKAVKKLNDDGSIAKRSDGSEISTELEPRWLAAMKARHNGTTIQIPLNRRDSALCYSRQVRRVVKSASARDREKRYEYFVVMRDSEEGQPRVTGDYLDGAQVEGDHVAFTFRSPGDDIFYGFTSRNKGQPMGIVLDGYLRSVAEIREAISSRGQITFGERGSESEMNRTVYNLTAGALPATLKPEAVSENTMGPTLGKDTIQAGAISVAVAFLAVLVFMLLYYRFAGLVACIALFANLLLTVAFMVLVKATFTLPGLAGLVLTLGMAVDANVLIYERLREERDRGAGLALAIRNGYDRAFPTIIDTHLSSIFTAIVLYVVGNDQLKGFGITLTVGLIISLFTSLYMTRLLFDLWLARGWLHKLSMFRFLTRTNFDFMAIRYYWFTATIVLTVVGGAIFIYRLDKGGLNIDFVGGTAYSAEMVEPKSIEDLRDLFAESRQERLLKFDDKDVVAEDEDPVDHKAVKFTITYAKDDMGLHETAVPTPVTLPEPATLEQFKKRASKLEDVAVEQIIVGSGTGGASAYFTIRTSEKSADLVQVMISRLMVEKKDGKTRELLNKILISNYEIDDASGKKAVLTFTRQKPDGSVALAYASKAQVTRLLSRQIESRLIEQLRKQRAELAAQHPEGTRDEDAQKANLKQLDAEISRLGLIKDQVEFKGIGEEEEGRFRWMELVLAGPLAKEHYALDDAALERFHAKVERWAALEPKWQEEKKGKDKAEIDKYIESRKVLLDASAAQLIAQMPPPSKQDYRTRASLALVVTKQAEPLAKSLSSDELNKLVDNLLEQAKTPKVEEAELSAAALRGVMDATSKDFADRPQPERLENFDSQLAQETQNRALVAIVASWIAILLYLWFRFGNWTFGLAAVLCLIHDLFFTLGIIAFCYWLHRLPVLGTFLQLRDFKIDLQTVAALLTLVGYSVSDTIVVFDRIREVRGKNPELTPKMINDSVNQTLSRTLLTAASVWLVVMVLYFVGGEGLHLFAFVMVIGVIVGTYSSIYIASPLLLIFGEGRRPTGIRETVPTPGVATV